LFDTVACACSRRLDAGIGASEPHDLAVRFSIIRPARCCSPDAAASTASRPAFVTCATPLLPERDVRISELIWVGSEAKYFCKRGLTRFRKIRSDLPVGSVCRGKAQDHAAMQSARRAIDAVAANDLCAMQTCGVRQVRCPLIGVNQTWRLRPPISDRHPKRARK